LEDGRVMNSDVMGKGSGMPPSGKGEDEVDCVVVEVW
jgi:hypothetical protein